MENSLKRKLKKRTIHEKCKILKEIEQIPVLLRQIITTPLNKFDLIGERTNRGLFICGIKFFKKREDIECACHGMNLLAKHVAHGLLMQDTKVSRFQLQY